MYPFATVRSWLVSRGAGSDYVRCVDVTEGSGGVWERLRYDWSDPSRVVLTTTDSNTWGGHSGYIYTFPRQPDGTTVIDVVVVREGKNFKGRMLGIVLGLIGKRVLGRRWEPQSRPSKRGTTARKRRTRRRTRRRPPMVLAGPIR
jgi:hypothetical protein